MKSGLNCSTLSNVAPVDSSYDFLSEGHCNYLALFSSYMAFSNIVTFYSIIHAFITRASSVMILNQSCSQSLGGQYGKGVDGLFEKVTFQTAFERVKNG